MQKSHNQNQLSYKEITQWPDNMVKLRQIKKLKQDFSVQIIPKKNKETQDSSSDPYFPFIFSTISQNHTLHKGIPGHKAEPEAGNSEGSTLKQSHHPLLPNLPTIISETLSLIYKIKPFFISKNEVRKSQLSLPVTRSPRIFLT